ESASRNRREPNEDRRVAGVVVGDEEHLRIGAHQDLPLIHADAKRERLAVLAKACQELASDSKRRRPVRGSLFHAWQGEGDLTYGVEGRHSSALYFPNARSRHRRTLITSNRSPSKTICFTVFLPLSPSRFSQSRTSI